MLESLHLVARASPALRFAVPEATKELERPGYSLATQKHEIKQCQASPTYLNCVGVKELIGMHQWHERFHDRYDKA